MNRIRSVAVTAGAMVLLAVGVATLPGSVPHPGQASPNTGLTPPPAWRTDFARLDQGITLDQFVRALAWRDLIPALDDPHVTPVGEADFLRDDEPVIAVEMGGEWRAYPMQIMIWYEIANDTLTATQFDVDCPAYWGTTICAEAADRHVAFQSDWLTVNSTAILLEIDAQPGPAGQDEAVVREVVAMLTELRAAE